MYCIGSSHQREGGGRKRKGVCVPRLARPALFKGRGFLYRQKKKRRRRRRKQQGRGRRREKRRGFYLQTFFPSLFSFPFISIPRPSIPPLKEEEEGQWFSSHPFGENCLAFVSFIFEIDWFSTWKGALGLGLFFDFVWRIYSPFVSDTRIFLAPLPPTPQGGQFSAGGWGGLYVEREYVEKGELHFHTKKTWDTYFNFFEIVTVQYKVASAKVFLSPL